MRPLRQVTFLISIILASFIGGATLSYAQTSETTGVQNTDYLAELNALASRIETESLASANNQSAKNPTIDKNALLLIRTQISNAFDVHFRGERAGLIQTHRDLAVRLASQTDIDLNKLFSDLDKALSKSEDPSVFEQANTILEARFEDDNWVVAHTSLTLSSYLHSSLKNYNTALQQATDAFAKIPQSETPETAYAKTLSYQTISIFHNVLGNTDLAMEVTKDLLNQARVVQFAINGAELINNLMYGFGLSHDVKALRVLSDYLLRIESRFPADLKGLTEFRVAAVLVTTGEYEKALETIKVGRIKSEDLTIRQYLDQLEVSALAGSGQVEAAQSKLSAFESAYPETTRRASASRELLHSKALIAMAEGDAPETLRFMREYNDKKIQRVMKANKSNSVSLLANLENNKQRQAERAKAQAEQNRLAQDALQHRIRNTTLALTVSGLLLLAAMFAIAFLAYRTRTTADLASAAEAALAGEKAKSQFLAVISHELRTPLNGIIGIADLLSHTAPTKTLRNQIGIINRSGYDLLKLVEQILDMSRIDANEMEISPEVSNIHDVVADVEMLWRQTIEGNGVTFTSFVDPSISSALLFDPLRIRQCINNLLSNAAKFTKQGRVHMHVTAAPAPDDAGQCLTVIVADTGKGIPAEVLSKLFKPFVQADSSVTRHYGGSGLGLAITRSLARVMGGDVLVNSRPGAGSEFCLTFVCAEEIGSSTLDSVSAELDILDLTRPISPPAQEGVIVPLADAAGAASTQGAAIIELVQPDITDITNLSGTRVLIVEDVISNQDVMKVFLEPEGCAIMCVANGYEALAALSTQEFDVVLMDIRMPEMDGIEATRLLRSFEGPNTHVPVIALTADATAKTNAQCMSAGANIFLTKPVIAKELLGTVRFVLSQDHSQTLEISAPHRPQSRRA